MSPRMTEQLHDDAPGLDARGDVEILSVLAAGQAEAATCVQKALPDIAQGAAIMADAVRSGARIVYAAAGSSGLMAMSDACELGGTFGIDPSRIAVRMAGGLPVDARMPGGTEDDAEAGRRDAGDIAEGEAVITISASGSTGYTLAFARAAAERGGRVIAIANNDEAPLFDAAEARICVPTPPELIAGSTRMGAGTAQKIALNMMSTLMGVRLGHVHDGMMVNVVADNDKLRARAAGMVARIAGVSGSEAERQLIRAEGAVKPAVLLARGAATTEQAAELLTETQGHLRAALARL